MPTSPAPRRRVAVGLEHAAIDAVDGHACAGRGERARDRDLGHAEGAEDRTRVEAVPRAGRTEVLDGRRVDGLGAVEADPPAREVEPVEPCQRPRRERVREVGARGGGTAEGRHPLHPARGRRHEVLGPGQHEIGARDHRQGEQTDQAHVVVQRQPRQQDVGRGIEVDPDVRRVEVREHPVVREHHALGLRRRSAGELQDRQRVRVVGRAFVVVRGGPARSGSQLRQQRHRRVAGARLEERRQVVVEDHERGVGGGGAGAGLGHELLDRRQAHRQGEDDDGRARQPGRLDRRHERTGGRPEEGDVVAGPDAPCLEDSRHASCVVVEPGPFDPFRRF